MLIWSFPFVRFQNSERSTKASGRKVATLADVYRICSPHLDPPDHLAPYVQALEACARGEAPVELTFHAPPQHGKSECAKHAFILIALMGGREKVLLAAGEAYLKGDYQWAAGLSGYAIRVDTEDALARAALLQQASDAGNARLEELDFDDHPGVNPLSVQVVPRAEACMCVVVYTGSSPA